MQALTEYNYCSWHALKSFFPSKMNKYIRNGFPVPLTYSQEKNIGYKILKTLLSLTLKRLGICRKQIFKYTGADTIKMM